MADRRAESGNANIHLVRYTLHKMGKTTAQIAEMHGVRELAIKKSIALVDHYRLTNTVDTLNTAIIDVVLSQKKNVEKALGSALTATVIAREGVKVPNHEIQLKAVAEVRQIVQAVQPKPSGTKGPTVLVNQQTGVHTAVPTAESKFTGFEERIRNIRRRVDEHNQLPPPESVAAPLGEDELDVGEEVESVEPQHTPG